MSVSDNDDGHVVRISSAFPKSCTGNESRSGGAMVATARQKRLYLHHQGEFQHQNYTLGSLHDSDHEDVVRILVGLSYEL